jgi:hypothetical protein
LSLRAFFLILLFSRKQRYFWHLPKTSKIIERFCEAASAKCASRCASCGVIRLTTITAQIWPGQGEVLEQRLTKIRTAGEHLFPGTSARYIVRDQRQLDEITIVLVWRGAAMPLTEQREAALAALSAELAGVLDWEAARVKEGEVLMHA